MFAFISGGYHPWDKFFIYHCDYVTMDYNAIHVELTLGTFAFKILHKSFVKIGIVFLHVLKRITHSLWLDKIFIQLAKARRKKTHNFWNKNHIQPQTIGDPIYIYLYLILLYLYVYPFY